MIGSSGFFADFATNLPELAHGLAVSLRLTALSLAVGVPCALLLALGVTARRRILRWPCVAIVEVGRGAPALVLLQLAYFGLPSAGLTLSAMLSAVVALGWTTAAYMGEYLRGGLAAVPPGEVEASHALGMTPVDTLRYVVVPQGLRIALPSLMGFAVMLFQATSLAYTVAVPELLSHAYSIGSSTFRYMNVLLAAGVLYAAVSMPCTWLSVAVERRLSKHTI